MMGNRVLADFAAELSIRYGLDAETMEESLGDNPQANLIIRPKINPSAPVVLEDFLLQTHLDTPDPGHYSLWSKTDQNPFDAHIIDGKIYGLGAAEVKLDFLCKLEALHSVVSTNPNASWKRIPVLAGTYGEELGMHGAMKLIRKNKVKAKYALIGEPSNLNLISAAKGIASVEIRIPFSDEENRYRTEHNLIESSSTQSRVFNGRASHSSAPQLGESAIKKMFEYLLLLPEDLTLMEVEGGVNFNTVPSSAFLELEFVSGRKDPMTKKLTTLYRSVCDLEQEFFQYPDPGFSPEFPTLNIGTIRTLADHVLITGNCRTTPTIGNDLYKKWMHQLTVVCKSIGADFRVTDYKQPFRANENSDFVKICIEDLKALNPNCSLTTQSSTNEASLFSRVGVECLCFGPGKRDGNTHTPDEHVSIADLMTAIEFYKKTITRFCL
jgi:succinyl-diaminopimelate desuccinylase